MAEWKNTNTSSSNGPPSFFRRHHRRCYRPIPSYSSRSSLLLILTVITILDWRYGVVPMASALNALQRDTLLRYPPHSNPIATIPKPSTSHDSLHHHLTSTSTTTTSLSPSSSSSHGITGTSTSTLFAYSSYYDDGIEREPDRSTARPRPVRTYAEHETIVEAPVAAAAAPPVTKTEFQRPAVGSVNPKPKIVVLGATGRIGKRVVKSLLAMEGVDMTVVAHVRDYDKACDVLYDELLDVRERKRGKGPVLEVEVGNLVAKSDVYGYRPPPPPPPEEDDDDDEDEDDGDGTTAARFDNESPSSPNTKNDDKYGALALDPDTALRSTFSDVTAVISAVRTVRPTLPFADYVFRPWRIFRRADRWCGDARHPYYVNYRTTEKVLKLLEGEMRKREGVARARAVEEEEVEEEGEGGETKEKEEEERRKVGQAEKVERIRFVRISDLCVSYPPWHPVALLTNVGRSMVFRDQERGENLLMASEKVDSIVLRPGDLWNDVRNETTTSLQVDTSGTLPEPAYVGRDDVASLAALLAVSDLEPQPVSSSSSVRSKNRKHDTDRNEFRQKLRNGRTTNHDNNEVQQREARHWTIAMRWADRSLCQGTKADGRPTTLACLDQIVRREESRRRAETRKDLWSVLRRHRRLRRGSGAKTVVAAAAAVAGDRRSLRRRRTRRQRLKPYGMFVFLSMVVTVYPLLASLISRLGKEFTVVGKGIELAGDAGRKVVVIVWAWIALWFRVVVHELTGVC